MRGCPWTAPRGASLEILATVLPLCARRGQPATLEPGGMRRSVGLRAIFMPTKASTHLWKTACLHKAVSRQRARQKLARGMSQHVARGQQRNNLHAICNHFPPGIDRNILYPQGCKRVLWVKKPYRADVNAPESLSIVLTVPQDPLSLC